MMHSADEDYGEDITSETYEAAPQEGAALIHLHQLPDQDSLLSEDCGPWAPFGERAQSLAGALNYYDQTSRELGVDHDEYNPWGDLIGRHPLYDEVLTMEADPAWHSDRVVLRHGDTTTMVVHDALSNRWLVHQGLPLEPSTEPIAVLLRRSQPRLQSLLGEERQAPWLALSPRLPEYQSQESGR